MCIMVSLYRDIVVSWYRGTYQWSLAGHHHHHWWTFCIKDDEHENLKEANMRRNIELVAASNY